MYSRTCTGSSVPSPPVIILATGWTQADAIASLIVVALMLKAAWELLRDSGWILLEAAPKAMGPRGYARPPCWPPSTSAACTTCTPGPSPRPCPRCHAYRDLTTPASPTAALRGCWTSCRPASPGTSTSSTPPSSSKPSPTPTTNSAPTEHPRGGVGTTPGYARRGPRAGVTLGRRRKRNYRPTSWLPLTGS